MQSAILILIFCAAAALGQAQHQQEIRAAVEKALPALQKASPVFMQKNGCPSCHHQSLPAQTTAMAAKRGYRYDKALEAEQLRTVQEMIYPAVEVMAETSDTIPQITATGPYILMHLEAQGVAPNDATTALVHNIASKQRLDGSWTGFANRPPLSGGDIRETAVSVRGLDLYAPKGRRPEMNRRIAKAKEFLLSAKPASPEEKIARLLGLTWAGASMREMQGSADEVLTLQRADGGWAQLDTRESDAYATGEALVALYRAGTAGPGSAAFDRGLRYLLRTQQADGSWHVKTRSYALQPLIDTGYPHGRDQWISAAGTSYAAMALMLADPVQ
jgi:hypothetical protein